jgi:hypothetical protein
MRMLDACRELEPEVVLGRVQWMMIAINDSVVHTIL